MASLRLKLPIIVIILVGFSLRIHDLQAAPLRGDEAFSALYWSDIPISQSLSRIAPIDPHPPLAFLLFRFWALILGGTESVFSLRFASALGNTLGIPAMFALAYLLTRRRSASLIAALIWALHPYEIWHSQDYRNYAIWAGLSAVSLWLWLRLIQRRGRIDAALYAVAAFCAGLIFYSEIFNILALSCIAIVLAWRRRQFLYRFLSLQLALGLAPIAAFALIQARSNFFGAYGGNLESFSAIDYLTRFIPTLAIGDYFNVKLPALWPVVALLYLVAALIVLRTSKRQFASLMILTWLPLLLLGAVSLSRDIFNPRYVLNAVPALILLIVIASLRAAEGLRKFLPLSREALTLSILAPWFALAGIALHAYFNDPEFRKSPAWDELGRFLSVRATEDDLVIQLSVDPAFAYYYAGKAPEMALPAQAAQPEAEIIATLEGLQSRYETVFVVAREQAGWGNAGAVERWMNAHLQEVMRTDAGGLPVRQYADWPRTSDFPGDFINFADTVGLLGYKFFPAPLPTGELVLWVYWLPLSKTERPLKSFTHVYGDIHPETGGALWSQDDQFPLGGRRDSTSWQIGAVMRDVYYLPARKLQSGDYQIAIGWYDAATGQRLTMADGDDALVLESFHHANTVRTRS